MFDFTPEGAIKGGGTPITGYPFTLSCWFIYDNTTEGHIISIHDLSAVQLHGLFVNLGSNTFKAGSFVSSWQSGSIGSLSTGTLYHGCGVFASATSRKAYIDGGAPNENTTNRTPSGLDNIAIGGQYFNSGGPTQSFNGRAGEIAVWDVALTDDEVGELADRLSPTRVRPDALVFYDRLISDKEDSLGETMTLDGASHPVLADASTHPQIYMPPAQILQFPPAAGAPVVLSQGLHGVEYGFTGQRASRLGGVLEQ